MAIEFLTTVWRISPYKAEKLLVQLALADWCNESGECYPSLTEIAKKARITKPGAIKIIHQMIEDGQIILIQVGHGRGNRSMYRFSDEYVEASRQTASDWQESKARKGKRGLPNKKVNENIKKVNEVDLLLDAEKVNEKREKVNENTEKVNETLAHIRKNRHKPSIEPSVEIMAASRRDDPFFKRFKSAYETFYGCPYQHKQADFIQLANLRKKDKDGWLSLDRWQTGVDHYFASEIGGHTLADLSSRFGAFFRSTLDRFGKPRTTTINGVANVDPRTAANVAIVESWIRKQGVQ